MVAMATLSALCLLASGNVSAFGLDDIDKRAKDLAAKSYVKPDSALPKALRDLSYEQYRDIRFRPERSLWHDKGLPLEVRFFHEGTFYDQPVKIHEVAGGKAREIPFSPDDFDFGGNNFDAKNIKGIGFAGFRLHFALNTPKVKDEVLVFLGASYFRALGQGQVYGASARGLAIDTAEKSGEEFPRFTEFWIERPAVDARQFTIYGLLDSPRATGAYRFVVTPGVETEIAVKARLYLRDKVAKLGLAPLSSMYFYGENQPAERADYRPEVHDSDGLSVQTSAAEWLWRPLVNPKRLLVTSFGANDPKGFGLQQRDRDFASYEELSTRYDRRPSVWIEPKGKWGAGRVELVQIPSPDETNDNIVAYWVPEKQPKPQEAYALEYRMLWQAHRETRPPMLWVAQTRRGPGFIPKHEQKPGADANSDANRIMLQIDFAPPPADDKAAKKGEKRGAAKKADDKKSPAKAGKGDADPSSAAGAAVQAATEFDKNAELVHSRVEPNAVNGGWRLTLIFKRLDPNRPVEMRAGLTQNNQPVSETWSYILPPG